MSGVPLLRTEFGAADLPLLRSLVEEACVRAGLAAAVRGVLVQAVAEIATNAVEHGSGAGLVELRAHEGELCCEVTGYGPGPAAGRPTGLGPRLAGALIAGALPGAGALRVRGTEQGTLVTLSAPLPGSATAPPAR
ncbi:ATP-binding protein [Streptomyces bottropensis]|uniref:ATP-binding protein n=1 Tax=Streptomyces bottropensis TaxID=42235 RepID=UPI00369E735A